MDIIGPEFARFTEVSTDGFKVQLLSIKFLDNKAEHTFFLIFYVQTIMIYSNYIYTKE